MKRYDIVTSTNKISDQSLEPFIDGLRYGIKESSKNCRAVFIEGEDVIHAMSWGSEFNRLCESAELVGVYQHQFSADALREDLNRVIKGAPACMR